MALLVRNVLARQEPEIRLDFEQHGTVVACVRHERHNEQKVNTSWCCLYDTSLCMSVLFAQLLSDAFAVQGCRGDVDLARSWQGPG
jgi:hypothetical protein